MRSIRNLLQKHAELLRYLAIGGVTTLIDIACFAMLYEWLGMPIEPAKVITWIVAVSFAFAGNKWIVFQTETPKDRAMFREALGFFAARLLSLGFALLFNHIAVRSWGWNGSFANGVSMIFVTMINYVLGKWIIFRKQ